MGVVETLWNTPSHPATDEQLAYALLSVGNGNIVRLVREDPQLSADRHGKGADVGTSYAPLAQEIANTLDSFVRDPATVAEAFLSSDAIRLIRDCRASLTIGLGTMGITRGMCFDFPTLKVAMNYAVSVLLDSSLPYGRTLCRCRLKSCAIFYFAVKNPKGGPPNRNYCTPEHLRIANDSKSKRAPKPSTASASKLRKRKDVKS